MSQRRGDHPTAETEVAGVDFAFTEDQWVAQTRPGSAATAIAIRSPVDRHSYRCRF